MTIDSVQFDPETMGFVDNPARFQHLTPTISDIMKDQSYYLNKPDWQRGEAWPKIRKYMLIDSILRGFLMHVVYGYTEKNKLFIVDGWQRMTAIRQFHSGLLRTPTTAELLAQDPSTILSIESRKKFKDLDPFWRERFNRYPVHLFIMDGVPDSLRRNQFRRLQWGKALYAGEIMRTYLSRAVNVVEELLLHDYWNKVYKGFKRRQEVFQMSSIMLYLSLNQWPTPVLPENINLVIGGHRDSTIPKDCEFDLKYDLDLLGHLFVGADMFGRTDIIPQLMVLSKLKEKGVSIERAERGCLASWLNGVKKKSISVGGHESSYVRLFHAKEQRAFWEREEERVLATPGLRSSQVAVPSSKK